MSVEAKVPAMFELIDCAAPVEQLCTGFQFTEGPIWNPKEQCLYFSDMPSDVRRRWSAAAQVEQVRNPSNKCNGMTYDGAGNLYVCEHSTSLLAMETPAGERKVLASHFGGKELNSPNDVVVRSDNTVYFSDPTYGRMPGFGLERPQDLDFQGLYRISPDGELHLEARDFGQPNGLCFSPDETLLYVNDTTGAHIRVFDVAPDGSLSGSRIFAGKIGNGVTGGMVDGMKCDERGNIYVTGPDGIWVIDPAGTHLGVIQMPEHAGNLNWGGANWDELFCACSTSIYRVKMKVRGNPVAYMRRGRKFDSKRTALILQELQNDVVGEEGAFTSSGAPAHAKKQNLAANIAKIAAAARKAGVAIIHVHYVVEPGAAGLKQNAPLFKAVAESGGLVRGSWGAAPAPGFEPQPGDIVVEKMRMNAFHGTRLEAVLQGCGVDTIVITGGWTNMSIEHTARHAADAGYQVVLATDGTFTIDEEWQNVALNYALQNVAERLTAGEIAAGFC
jgi:gluconolactonase